MQNDIRVTDFYSSYIFQIQIETNQRFPTFHEYSSILNFKNSLFYNLLKGLVLFQLSVLNKDEGKRLTSKSVPLIEFSQDTLLEQGYILYPFLQLFFFGLQTLHPQNKKLYLPQQFQIPLIYENHIDRFADFKKKNKRMNSNLLPCRHLFCIAPCVITYLLLLFL